MSETFHIQSVKRSRKRRQCSWCGESIDIGEPYNSYRFRDCGDIGKAIMHPECYVAMQLMAEEERGWLEWSVGDFSRGCGCEQGFCECENKTPLTSALTGTSG